MGAHGFVSGVALAAALLGSACGPSDGDAGDDGDGDSAATPTSIVVTPADATLEVTYGAASPGHGYVATAHYADGSTADVTASAQFFVDAAPIAFMTGAELTATGQAAGRTSVRAVHAGVTGATTVTIRLKARILAPGAPPEAPGWFDAASEDAARAPAIVYPSDGTLIPPNLGTIETHFAGGAGNDLWEVAVASPLVDYRVYTPATTPAHLVALAGADFGMIARAHRSGAVKITVRGLAQAMPAVAGTSTPIVLSFGLEDLQGGIYYWAASASGIYRHDFAKTDEPAEQFFGPPQAAGRCVACHALSRDGTRMALTYDGGDGEGTVIDVATRTPLYPANKLLSNFSAFAPDGQKFLTTSQGVIRLHATATGDVLATVPTPGTKATHPDFAPAGDRIVWAAYGTGSDWSTTGGGQIYVQPFDDTTNSFGAATILVDLAGTGPRPYYPSFSPDGKWVLFNTSLEDGVPQPEDFYDDPSAQMWVVPTDGSRPPMRVAAADVASGLTNSWARWAPFEQETGGEMNEPVFWFTVSSKRAYGVRKPLNNQPQIWMAPFFPARAAAGEDPSRPMFWLPFQDLGTSNHIAQWTEEVVPIE